MDFMPAEAPFSSGAKGLPFVVPPSGKEIARLFLTPLLIVIGLVIPLVGFFWWFGGAWTPEDYLAKLDDPNADVRWRGAEYLGQMLLRDDNLASNAKFGLDLADRLRQTLDSSASAERALAEKMRRQPKLELARDRKELEPGRDHILYLGSCLGNLTIPVGAPLLCRIAMTQDGAEPEVLTRRRWQALWALANLGENLKRFQRLILARREMVLAELETEASSQGERAEWARAALEYMTGPQAHKLQGLGVDKALALCAQDRDPFLREITAFALNFWEGDASERGRLEEMLAKLTVDGGQGEETLHPLREEVSKSEEAITKVPGLKIRYNATVALARRGSDKAPLGVLQEMLDEPLQRDNFVLRRKNGEEVPDEATVRVTALTALQAVSELHRKRPERDLSSLYPAVETFAHSPNTALQTEAERTLKALGSK
jgi:hypothetical protein